MKENTREISILKRRILEYLEVKGVSKYECYKNTSITNGVLSQSNGLSEDNLMRFLSYYTDISYQWLFTGNGSMLKQIAQKQEDLAQSNENALISSDKDRQNTDINQAETSYIYKMYQEEREEKKKMLKEKDSKIDHLQSELRAMEKELATLKAKYPESTIDQPEGLGPSETAPHAPSHPHSPTSEHYYGSSLPPHQENQ